MKGGNGNERVSPRGGFPTSLRTCLFALIPLLSMATVFYNVRVALLLCFLLPIVHFLPGRVDALLSGGRADSDEPTPDSQ